MSQFVPDGLNVFHFLKKNHILQDLIYLVLHLRMNNFVKRSHPPHFLVLVLSIWVHVPRLQRSPVQDFWLDLAFVSSAAGVFVSSSTGVAAKTYFGWIKKMLSGGSCLPLRCLRRVHLTVCWSQINVLYYKSVIRGV